LNALVFQVDLFSARGVLPRDIQDVMARHKDIMYSSRTRYTTDVYRRLYALKMRLAKALARVPDGELTDEERRLRDELADLAEITILHIIYQQRATPRTTSSPAPRCASTGKAATKTPAAPSSARNGRRCRRKAPASSSTTFTARKIEGAKEAGRAAGAWREAIRR
jgi:hypothetical protein